jgi:hypothetical protein
MKRVNKLSILAVMMITMLGCGGGGGKKSVTNESEESSEGMNGKSSVSDESKGSSQKFFNVKQATIVYDLLGGFYQETVYFDDYGAKMRIDDKYYITIFDEASQKAYQLNIANKTYEEISISELYVKRNTLKMTLSDADATKGGLTVTKKTIAGKECSIHSVEKPTIKTSTGGWNGILFFASLNDENSIQVVSFSETVPGNFFTIPEEYTKE